MASLKDLKNRIGSVKSTQKITKAMQMVAAAKLRKATERAENARPYAEQMEALLQSLVAKVDLDNAPTLLAGTGKDDTHLLVVMTSDRGLCGGFNGSIVRSVKNQVAKLQGEGKTVKILCIGSKGFEQLESSLGEHIIGKITDLMKKQFGFSDVQDVCTTILDAFEEHACDNVTIVYNAFKSAMVQEVTYQQLIPLEAGAAEASLEATNAPSASYEYEPEESAIMEDLLPRNIKVQVFKALLESAASEQGARMTAMDNATRNAGDMIKKLEQVYNRTRQATITKELIEIISGAEAV